MAILAYPDPVFQPAMRIIASISNGFPAVVTTTFANQYISGIIVRLNVPKGFGMVEANQLYGPIVVTGDTTFTIDLDTRTFTPFIAPTIVDTTDGAGNASGSIAGTQALTGLGQYFNVGTQLFTVTSRSGSLSTSGSGSGTMNLDTGAYTFTGCAANTSIYWTGISSPFNKQSATVTALGEINSQLLAPERNVLPYSAT